MSYKLKVRYGTAVEPWHTLAPWYRAGTTAMGQMTWPGVFGMEPHLLAAGSFGAGMLAMYLLRRMRMKANRRPRRR